MKKAPQCCGAKSLVSFKFSLRQIAGNIAITGAMTPGTAGCVKGVKRTLERRGMKTEEYRRGGHNLSGGILNDVKRPQRACFGVQSTRLKVWPHSGVQPLQQRSQCCDGFRRAESAMAGAMDKNLSQEMLVARLVHHVTIRALILVGDQPITFRMHGQHGKINVAIENDVLLQIIHRIRIGGNPCSLVQRIQIIIQAESCQPVKRAYFSLVGGVFKLLSVIHTCIPGGIAAGAEFEFCPEGKDEWEIHLL